MSFKEVEIFSPSWEELYSDDLIRGRAKLAALIIPLKNEKSKAFER